MRNKLTKLFIRIPALFFVLVGVLFLGNEKVYALENAPTNLSNAATSGAIQSTYFNSYDELDGDNKFYIKWFDSRDSLKGKIACYENTLFQMNTNGINVQIAVNYMRDYIYNIYSNDYKILKKMWYNIRKI